jgi:hypothetical protein
MALTAVPERAGSRPGISPFGMRHIWIPLAGRRAAVAGLSMHPACKPVSVALQRATCAAVMLAGPIVLPGRQTGFRAPLDSEAWSELLAGWRSRVGRWDDMVLYHRPQSHRRGFAALLLRDGRGLAFVRVAPDAGRTAHEFAVMRGVHAGRPRSFRIALPLAQGTVAGYGWLAVESGPNYPLGAVRHSEVRRRVVAEVGELLAPVLDRPVGTPGHWRPCHGDLAPWNLRVARGGRVWVVDWEDAGFAPPGADELYSRLTAQITFGRPAVRAADRECVDWMTAMITARRSPDEPANSENTRLLAALNGLRRG